MIRRPALPPPGSPLSPAYKRLQEWCPVNRGFYQAFRDWLRNSDYSPSALKLYSLVARLALSVLDQPYWQIDPDVDLNQVCDPITAYYANAETRTAYGQGLAKLAQYLRLRCHRLAPDRPIHWEAYLGPLPAWMADDVRAYLAHCRRNWPAERQREMTVAWLCQLTRPLRDLVAQTPLTSLTDLTPSLWFAYLDTRLAAGITPRTLNSELGSVLNWLRFLAEQDRPICARLLKVKPLNASPHLPKDVPPEQLRRLQAEILAAAHRSQAQLRRMGRLDCAWFLLMLHSGLRTGEVRRLQLRDIDWENRRVRIEQSKGLKDRLVPLSPATLAALTAYLEERGPASALPGEVFIYRHVPLGMFYCGRRLTTYGQHCGVRVRPHQLRHSCATLLLNAGAPVLTVQTILGHKHIDTTLGYARLYDGTVAADYYRAMAQVESRMALAEDAVTLPPGPGELLALVDSLRNGTLNETQIETVRALRTGIMAQAHFREETRPA